MRHLLKLFILPLLLVSFTGCEDDGVVVDADIVDKATVRVYFFDGKECEQSDLLATDASDYSLSLDFYGLESTVTLSKELNSIRNGVSEVIFDKEDSDVESLLSELDGTLSLPAISLVRAPDEALDVYDIDLYYYLKETSEDTEESEAIVLIPIFVDINPASDDADECTYTRDDFVADILNRDYSDEKINEESFASLFPSKSTGQQKSVEAFAVNSRSNPVVNVPNTGVDAVVAVGLVS